MNFNLLPWREARRLARKRSFNQSLLLSALMGMLVVIVVMLTLEGLLSNQSARNAVLENEMTKLDTQIKEIVTLDEEIKSLKLRQAIILNLQAARNQPVYLLDELVDLTPVGVILKSIKQAEVIALTGHAQSNTLISDFLHNIDTNSRYLSKTTLVESKLTTVGQGRELRKLFEFTITLAILDRPKER
jgi:type IV pilus assembly protein PilN